MKLCVGAEGVDDLRQRQTAMLAAYPEMAGPWHTTRMFPKRGDEILDGGSLYWVIAGKFAVRQPVIGLTPVRDSDGTAKCRIDLAAEWIPVEPLPRRAFQGWRYLTTDDAPRDLSADQAHGQALLGALSKLGLL